MPIREPDIEAQRLNYWRHYRFGDLAALATLETRHSARAQQIDYGDFVEQGFDAETAARIDALFSEHVPEVRWTDNLHQGYIRLTLERTQARADFVAVSTVFSPDYSVFVLRTEILERREDTLVYRDPV